MGRKSQYLEMQQYEICQKFYLKMNYCNVTKTFLKNENEKCKKQEEMETMI